MRRSGSSDLVRAGKSREVGRSEESEDRREMSMYAFFVGEDERLGGVKKALMALALLAMMAVAMVVAMASPARADTFTVTRACLMIHEANQIIREAPITPAR